MYKLKDVATPKKLLETINKVNPQKNWHLNCINNCLGGRRNIFGLWLSCERIGIRFNRQLYWVGKF